MTAIPPDDGASGTGWAVIPDVCGSRSQVLVTPPGRQTQSTRWVGRNPCDDHALSQ